ncbi:MAG: hypothetical protein JW787_00770 [Sedimentisphaerales bacterium]|nr:hypothetical protein [Sedimentisphaerales bacterium]
MKRQNNIDISKAQWTHPMGLKELSQIFEVHRNTMSKWLKKQILCNRQLSPRKWEIATFELPYDSGQDNIKLYAQDNIKDIY